MMVADDSQSEFFLIHTIQGAITAPAAAQKLLPTNRKAKVFGLAPVFDMPGVVYNIAVAEE